MRYSILAIISVLSLSISMSGQISGKQSENASANPGYATVEKMAYDILKTGFNAGDGYNQVWARDLNTFVKFSCKVLKQEVVREALLKFFYFQGFDGNMIDGYEEVDPDYKVDNYGVFARYDMPGYVFHKNTVETDQETSLLQAVYKYILATGDETILAEEVHGMSVLLRMEKMLDFLMKHKFNKQYGLIWGATTADWGDVQARDPWGVKLDDQSVISMDIYDNAMMLLAIENYLEMYNDPGAITKWKEVYRLIKGNVRKYLWDEKSQKFKPPHFIVPRLKP